MIRSERHSDASAAVIHELLVDVGSWRLWSPHISSVESSAPRVGIGWAGRTRAFFAPFATSMVVDDVYPDGGYDWHSTLGPWKLRYRNRVEAEPGGKGSTIRFSAGLDGPLSALLQLIVSPISAYGQRRRMRRLADLADVVERRLAAD